jgi:hypothetical protein
MNGVLHDVTQGKWGTVQITEMTMATTCELAQRNTIQAFRVQKKVLIVAEGELPSPGFDVKITQRPEKIFPPFFQILRCPRSGFFPQIVVPYRHSQTIDFPEDRDTVIVFHADGRDEVQIQACGDELSAYSEVVGGGTGAQACPEGADEATGFSRNLSFDEAFADAIAGLPKFEPEPGQADILETVRVVEIGGLFGGFAGFNDLFVRVCRTTDG